jgi:hypothetical protein
MFNFSPPPSVLNVILSSSLLCSAREEPPWGIEPRIELQRALQKADTLPTEITHTLAQLRLTVSELHRTVGTERGERKKLNIA